MTPESRDEALDDRHRENLRRFAHLEGGQQEVSKALARIENTVTRIETQLTEREAERAEIKEQLKDLRKDVDDHSDEISRAKGAGGLIAFILASGEVIRVLWEGLKK